MLTGLQESDCREILAAMQDNSVQAVITSPPYNIGKAYEERRTVAEFMDWITPIMRECARVVSPGGSIFWQVGNYVAGGAVTPLDLLMYPVFAGEGLTLRNRIAWTFGHGMHCTKRFSGRHEVIMWMTKGGEYHFNLDPVRVPQKYPGKRHFKGPKKGQLSGNPLGKNPGDVWDIPNVKHNHPEKTAHPCQFPEELVRRALLCSTREGDTVFDPFLGSGTTAVVAERFGRKWIGCETKAEYAAIAQERISTGRNVENAA